jgi:hypothetical protein
MSDAVIAISKGDLNDRQSEAIKAKLVDDARFTVSYRCGKRRRVGKVVCHEVDSWDHPTENGHAWGACFHLHRVSNGFFVANITADWTARGDVYVSFENHKPLGCYVCNPILLRR